MVSKVERKARILADGCMARNPGVTRQEAKRRVRPHACLAVLAEESHAATQRFSEAMGPTWLRFKEAVHREASKG